MVATPTMVNPGFMVMCPPMAEQPTSRAQSLKPRIINGATRSRSFSAILADTAKSISTLSHSVPPTAYNSNNTFKLAILP